MAAFTSVTAGIGLATALATTGMGVAKQIDAAGDFQQGGGVGEGGWESSFGQGDGGFQPTQLQNIPLGPDEDDGMMPGGAMGFGPWVGGGQGGG